MNTDALQLIVALAALLVDLAALLVAAYWIDPRLKALQKKSSRFHVKSLQRQLVKQLVMPLARPGSLLATNCIDQGIGRPCHLSA